jgi:sec-independent protein translocase protein TatB
MPSTPDFAFIVLLALLLFGPKKLPQLARQLGKLMADFRRASNEFRTQMEEELRISEQADRQKQIAAIEAAAPASPAIDTTPDAAGPNLAPEEHGIGSESAADYMSSAQTIPPSESEEPAAPGGGGVPIATSGELSILPPATGLPIANTPAVADETSHSATEPTPAPAPAHESELETETLHG